MRFSLPLIIIFYFTSYACSANKELIGGDKNHTFISIVDIIRAKSLYNNNEYNRCINYSINALKNKNTNTSEYIELIAKSYEALEDYHNSINYYEKLIIETRHKTYSFKIKNYIKIARIYRKLESEFNLKKGIEYLQKAENLTRAYQNNINDLYTINNNLGNFYKLLNQKDKALKHYLKALSILNKTNNKSKLQLHLINLGVFNYNGVESSNSELELSKKYLKKALKINIKKHHSVIHKFLGIVNYLQNDTHNSLKHLNKSIETLLNINLKSIYELPRGFNIKQQDKKKLVFILYEKYYSWIKHYTQTKNKIILEYASQTLILAEKLIDDIFINIKDEKSQVFWRQQASYFYYLGAHLSYLNKNPEKTFYYTEKNKALLLLLNTIRTQNHSKIPSPILKTKKTITNQIANLQNIKKPKSSDSIDLLILNKKEKLREINTYIETNFINKENYKKSLVISSLKKNQKQIADGTIYFSFIWDKTENQFNTLYGIAFTNKYAEVFKINDIKKFEKIVNDYKKSLSNPHKKNEDKNKYISNAFNLYNKLFPTESIKKLLKKQKKVIIIPDNDLSTIPFEALITDLTTEKLFIENYEVNYALSLSYHKKNNDLKRNANKDFISFAPLNFKYDNLKPLKESQKEVDEIQKTLRGNIMMEDKATKQSFLSEINNYKIIHLSTHANANDSISPWIAFKNKKLYLNELYTAKNQAELVVINACNSSLGKINSGEGVFSLARGFFYSGAKSVISSLWNVNDKSNSEITINFYKYLKKDFTKSAALRQAKLDYLKTHSLSEASPYYWSSLILIGDDSAIQLKKNHNQLIYRAIVLILAIFLILFILFIKKSKILGNKF